MGRLKGTHLGMMMVGWNSHGRDQEGSLGGTFCGGAMTKGTHDDDMVG